jgi:Ca2+/Na+ antiporter
MYSFFYKLKGVLLLFLLISFAFFSLQAQCSVCTKTAQQMGEKPARALNTGILYLAFAPIAIAFFIGYKWWKHNRNA